MPDFGLVGSAYEAPSIYQDTQELINWRPEIDPTLPEGDRNVIALYPTPGLTLIAQFPNQQEVRGLRAISGGDQLLAVCGSLVYVLDRNFTTTSLVGQLNTGRGAVSIVDNGQWVYITDGPYRYTWRINNNPVASFMATIVGSVLTVSSVFTGTITPPMQLNGLDIPQGVIIVSNGTGTGGVGTYNLNINVPLIAASRLYGIPVSSQFNNSYISGNRLFVSSGLDFVSGQIYLGQTLIGEGVSPNTIIVRDATSAQGNESLTGVGKDGTYTVNNTQTQGSITAVNRSAAGTGYTTLPTLNIAKPLNPLGQQAIVTIDSLAASSVVVAAAGTGYAVNQNLIVLGGVFTTPIIVRITAVNTNGGITGLVIVVAGKYTEAPTSPAMIFPQGTSSGTGATVTVSMGIGTDFTIIDNGSGYIQNPVFYQITGGGGTGAAVAIAQGVSPVPQTFYGLDFTQLPSNDGAFPTGIGLTILDNLFIYAEGGSQRFAASDALSPITRPLSFSLMNGTPDDCTVVFANNREIFVLGERSSEIWVNQGSTPFALQRIPGAATQQGTASPYSVARLGSSIAYVSRNSRGEGQVVYLEGYTPQRISTHAVENSIRNQVITDARAFTYQLEGHEIYVVTFPSADVTWCYDLATGLWHKWMRWDEELKKFRSSRARFGTQFNGRVIVGDVLTGKIYYLDNDNPTEDGVPVHRLRRAPHIVVDYKQEYHSAMQVYFQPGVGTNFLGRNPRAMLRWSNDGGSTWSNEYWQDVGAVGEYKRRAIWRRLGRARDRVYELRVTDPVNWVVISAELVLEAGVH